jgi:hypothetical protein
MGISFTYRLLGRLCHFSPEDEDSMFLQNIGIELKKDMAPKSKTTPTSY